MIVAAVLWFAIGQAQTIGPLSVEVVRPRQIAQSQPTEFAVVATGPDRVEVAWPKLDRGERFGPFIVLDTGITGPDRLKGKFGIIKMVRWAVTLEPVVAGLRLSASLELKYREGAEPWHMGTVTFPPFDIVADDRVAGDTLDPIPPLPGAPTASNWPALLRWAGFLVLAITVLVWISLRRPEQRRRKARRAALARLDELPRQTPIRASIDQACAVVRDFLEDGMALANRGLTTAEFLAAAASSPSLTAEQRAALTEFLQSADVARFTATEPNADACRHCLERARAFLLVEAL